MARLASAVVIAWFVALVAGGTSVSAQGPPLRIVVLSGEDSVNVIQQKTAVAPLVEVRDRNNNPVSGAVVTFGVQGGKAAAFQGGATTMTIVTNAAGQAAATGLTPLTAGAVNISVEAAFQGQVVTAAISQINVMTAAEAAAAAGGATGAGSGTGSTAGGAAGGGGGLSGTTIGIIGGVAAAGAVAGTQVLGGGGGGQGYSGPFALRVTVVFGNCARQEVYGGTLEVEIENHDSATAPLNGRANIKDAYNDVVATTCTGPIQVGRQSNWGMPSATVSGTEAALTFQGQDAVPAGDGSGTIARTYKFSGAVSGSTITGTFELSWQHQVQAVFRFTESQAVTLQKQ
jgi:hypothetical protein